MSDKMYGGPISPESSFGQGAEYAREYLDQLMRLRQAERTAAIIEQAAKYEADNRGRGTNGEMTEWRVPRAYDNWFSPVPNLEDIRYSKDPFEYRKSQPDLNLAMFLNTIKPQEYVDLLKRIEYGMSPGSVGSGRNSGQREVFQYMADAIMNALSQTRPDRDPAMLPQPTRTNMYGRFPGRE